MKLLSQIYFGIQRMLLPVLNEEMGPLSDKEKRFVEVCELARLDRLMENFVWCGNGRKPISRLAIAHAFVAKALWNLPTTRALIDRLQSDTHLRRLCGWHDGPSQVPNEATFSRAFAQFAKAEFGLRAHEGIVTTHLGEAIILHSATDSTAIEAREKAHTTKPPTTEPSPPLAYTLLNQISSTATPTSFPKQEAPTAQVEPQAAEPDKPKRKRGRPRKGEEPPEPDPTRLERHVTGSYQDNLLDMPKVQCTHGCKKNAKGHTDHWVGYKLHASTGDGDIPLAAYLSSASLHDSQAAIILQQAVDQRTKAVLYDLKDSAYDAATIKSHSQSLGSVPIIDANKRRAPNPVPMEPDRAQRYKARSSAERFNSDLKDNHGGRTVRVRGAAKVTTHLMFGVVVMTAEALLRLL